MTIHLNPDQVLYAQGGRGRLHRVTTIFSDVDAANNYMASAPGEAVIAVFDNFIFLARTDDNGFPLLDSNPLPRLP
jgi:hypothetical protein